MRTRTRPPRRREVEASRSHFAEAEQLRLAGRLAESVESYERALALDPRFTAALNNCGVALLLQGEFAAALAHHDRAILFEPRHTAFHFNRGRCLHALNRLPEAVAAWERCLELDPSFSLARHDLGVARLAMREVDRAVELLQEVVRAAPDYALARVNLAGALRARGDLVPAFEQAEAATRLAPDLADAWTVAVHLFSYVVDSVDGERGRAIFSGFDAAMQRVADRASSVSHGQQRPSFDAAMHRVADRASGDATQRAAVPSTPRVGAQATASEQGEARASASTSGHDRAPAPASVTATVSATDAPRASASRRLRVGFVSADLRAHPIGFYFEALTQWLHATTMDCFIYDMNPNPDDVTDRLRRAPVTWHNCHALDDAALARRIEADGIEVLVDLSGATAGNRLPVFARRPAPVQITWLAMPGSPGLSCIDARIADPWLDPGTADPLPGPERVVHMPHSWLCVLPDARAPDVTPPPCERNGYVTFGAFTGGAKLGERVLASWVKLLASVPDSRLIATGVPPGRAVRRVQAACAAGGVDADRLELVPHLPHLDWLARLGDADIALDSWPCNGTTTSVHTLWMGIPLVSHHGPTPTWRTGLSLLANLGLGSLSAPDEEGFLTLARDLAGDHGHRTALRAGMRERMRASPLMDGERFARDFEALLESCR